MPEVPGHRLVEGQDLVGMVLGPVEPVADPVLAGQDPVGAGRVPFDQGRDRVAEHPARQRAHLADLALQPLELGLELVCSSEPSRDVVLRQPLARLGEEGLGRPSSTSFPESMNAVRSETRAACCILCVTIDDRHGRFDR